ncbi:hypothetical protein [Nocardia carnea]|uniref:hypothetical protein n=1 Tax=Nocardia carnea TaxID=37328 RepID=UPI0024566B15|nr:hypothetical protein [Nocardia carnea]
MDGPRRRIVTRGGPVVFGAGEMGRGGQVSRHRAQDGVDLGIVVTDQDGHRAEAFLEQYRLVRADDQVGCYP